MSVGALDLDIRCLPQVGVLAKDPCDKCPLLLDHWRTDTIFVYYQIAGGFPSIESVHGG